MIKQSITNLLSILLLLILAGGIFFTSRLFIDVENSAKEYFIVLSINTLLVVCFATRTGIQKLIESVKTRLFLNGVALICLCNTIHGLLQYIGLFQSYHPSFPITGTYENPAGFAAVQALLFPFVFTNCFNKTDKKVLHRFFVIASSLCLISVLLSGSRTGALAMSSVIVVTLAFNDSVFYFFKTNRWIWIPILILFFLSLILIYHIKPDSADGRLFIWSRCFEMIKDKPLFGYGVNGFHRYYMSTQAEYFQNNPSSQYIMLADNIIHPFNEYIKLTICFGLVGLSAAIALLVFIIQRLFKTEKRTKILGLSFVSSILIMCQFSYPFQYAAVWLLTLVAIIPSIFIINSTDAVVLPLYSRIIASTLLMLFLSITLKRMYYDMKWAEISERSFIGYTDKMLKYYEGMKPMMKRNNLFIYNYAAELNNSGFYRESLEQTLLCLENWNDYDAQMLLASNYSHLQDKENAILSFVRAHNMIPCRFEPLYGEMLVFRDNNDTVNAIRMANDIIEKPIKIHSERVDFILFQAQQLLSEYD